MAHSTKRESLIVTRTKTIVLTCASVILTSRAQARFTKRKSRLAPTKTMYKGNLRQRDKTETFVLSLVSFLGTAYTIRISQDGPSKCSVKEMVGVKDSSVVCN